LFLRACKPKAHWHIAVSGEIGDPFQSLTHIIRSTPAKFLESVLDSVEKEPFREQKEANYHKLWQIENKKVGDFHQTFFDAVPFGEFKAIDTIIKALPALGDLHVANSMAVRYVNLIANLPKGV